MPIFWKAFILIVTIYLYNSFSAYHVNKWNDKNHKPFKENNVIMRIVTAKNKVSKFMGYARIQQGFKFMVCTSR